MVGADTLVNIEYIEFNDMRVRLDDPVHLQPTQHAHTPGADVLMGNDLGYTLAGGEGDDVFTGHGGDDVLYGGKGDDTAVYRGQRADYKLTIDTVTRLVYVSDQTAGRDGQDTVSTMETLRFADGDVAVSALFAAVPAQPALPALPALPAPAADPTSPDPREGAWKVYVTSAKYEFAPATFDVKTWDVKADQVWIDSRVLVGMYATSASMASGDATSAHAADPVIDSSAEAFVDLVGLADRQPWLYFNGCMEP